MMDSDESLITNMLTHFQPLHPIQGCDDRDCLIARSRPLSLFRDRDSDRDELKKTRPVPGSHDKNLAIKFAINYRHFLLIFLKLKIISRTAN